ncbi:MAG: Hsp20/alpha crystallin family protein [Candidatus Zixiibacteriota bacterium]|nr:MAG: Hsp20/alpha crystallin family protein [candidate division Zixibacteria bacterium]
MTYLTVRPSSRNIARTFDSFFNDFFRPISSRRFSNGSGFSPRVDIVDGKDDVRLTFELPGMKKDDIKVSLNDDVLTVSGERVFKQEKDEDSYVSREIHSGSFSRSFTLPDYVNRDKIKADYKNGLLELTLAKLEEVKPKEIEVKVS